MNEGKWGERLAAGYLWLHGCRILERNYTMGRYEIDLVAQDRQGTLLFVEVKTRGPHSYGLPREAVDAQKKRYVRRAADGYLSYHHCPDAAVRFDVVEVYTKPLSLVHIKDAF